MDKNTNRLVVLLVMVVTGTISLTEEQAEALIAMILSSVSPMTNFLAQDVSTSQTDTVRGMTEFAQILGVSVPTACKISKSGKFDAARLNFGTKKFVWDRHKLLEIARHEEKKR